MSENPAQDTIGDDLDFQIELADNDPEQPKSMSSTKQKKAAPIVDDPNGSYLSKAAHPKIVISHLLFKLVSLLCYILMSLAGSSNSLIFIIVTISCAFDFWIVKNVTGRLLVGLRWWSRIKEDGTEEWIFESV